MLLTPPLMDRLLRYVLGHFAALPLNYRTVIYFTTEVTNMYHILIKRQIIRLSNDISNI